jgi:hypothetical protein
MSVRFDFDNSKSDTGKARQEFRSLRSERSERMKAHTVRCSQGKKYILAATTTKLATNSILRSVLPVYQGVHKANDDSPFDSRRHNRAAMPVKAVQCPNPVKLADRPRSYQPQPRMQSSCAAPF